MPVGSRAFTAMLPRRKRRLRRCSRSKKTMAEIHLPPWPCVHKLDEVQFAPGEVVRIVVPPGFYWRSARDGIEVKARWWRWLWQAMRLRLHRRYVNSVGGNG